MQGTLAPSIVLGLVAGAFIFVALSQGGESGATRRAKAVGSFGTGFLLTWVVFQDPALLHQITRLIADRAVLIILAALAAALFFWKIRSLF